MERELRQKAQDETKQYWKMVSLLAAVLNHNNLIETNIRMISVFIQNKCIFNYRKTIRIAWLTEEEIENVSHLSPIHDIGKIRVPIEILNKNGKLTADEMGIVKQHPLQGQR